MKNSEPISGPIAKGASMLGFLKFIKDGPGGRQALDKIVASLPEESAKPFRAKIIAVGEYPYKIFVDFLRAADKELGKGDLEFCREMGKYTAARDVQALLSMSKARPDPEQLMSSIDLVWRSYHSNSGELKVVSMSPDKSVVRVTDFPQMDPAHCRLLEGILSQTMKELGCEWISEPRETKCMSKGADCHEFAGKWKKV